MAAIPGGEAAISFSTFSSDGGAIGSRLSRTMLRSKNRAGLPDIQPHAAQLDSSRDRAVRSRLIVAFVAEPDRELIYPLMAAAAISVTRSGPKWSDIWPMLTR